MRQLSLKTGVWRYVNCRIHDHSQHGRLMIGEFAKPEVAEKYLPELLAGEKLGSYCLTEPNAGSDAGSLKPKRSNKATITTLLGKNVYLWGRGDRCACGDGAHLDNGGKRRVCLYRRCQ